MKILVNWKVSGVLATNFKFSTELMWIKNLKNIVKRYMWQLDRNQDIAARSETSLIILKRVPSSNWCTWTNLFIAHRHTTNDICIYQLHWVPCTSPHLVIHSRWDNCLLKVWGQPNSYFEKFQVQIPWSFFSGGFLAAGCAVRASC